MPVAWIVEIGEHVHGDIAILRGDFRTAHQRQMEVVRRLPGLLPSGGRIVVGDCHTMQAERLRLLNHFTRRARAIREHGMAMQIPALLRRSRWHDIFTHDSIVNECNRHMCRF